MRPSHHLITSAREPIVSERIDPNRRLRVGLAIFSGAVVYENLFLICRYFFLLGNSLREAGNIFLFISSLVSLVYTLFSIIYIFKGRQDGSLMFPLSIFGGVQLIFSFVMRTIFLVRSLKRISPVLTASDYFVIFMLYFIFIFVAVI